MKKPFELTFFYTPIWKQNRTREKGDQLVFKFRDLPEAKRIAEQERVYDELKASTPEEVAKTDLTKYVLSLKTNQFGIVKEFVKKYLISFEPFAVLAPEENAEPIYVTNVEEIAQSCDGLLPELYGRLLNGPDADELKN